MAKEQTITKRSEDYSEWYLDVIKEADLADYGPVRGSMVIKPNGYAIWENIQKVLNDKFKKSGIENAYFPSLIPEGYLKKEAKHVEGFAPECFVVTHAGGKSLEEPLVVRPTSETIIYEMFSRWVTSYRDLPLLMNQWVNVLRSEMRTRLFLRTSEFLWQEGHTAHATEKEAGERARQMIDEYADFAKEYLAMPVFVGEKTETERFPGAQTTYTIEGMMQDGKALQSGTSHLLDANFTQAFNIKFLDSDGVEKFVRSTSWGVSTRIIGGIIMTHSDDKGLVLPPKIAPIKAVIIPVYTSDEEKKIVIFRVEQIAKELRDQNLEVKVDNRDLRPGPKFFEWEKKGVPIRIEIGPRDVQNNSAIVVRRDNGEKLVVEFDSLAAEVVTLLDRIQVDIYNRALKFREEHTTIVSNYDELKKSVSTGFAIAHWCGNSECEKKINEETKATIRCIPFDQSKSAGKCIYCGKQSAYQVIFARAY